MQGYTYNIEYTRGINKNSTATNRNLKITYGTEQTIEGMTTVIADDQNISATAVKNISFVAPSTGTYYLGFNSYATVSEASESKLMLDDVLISKGVLAVSNINADSKISVFPNPVKDILKFSDIHGIKSITVSDMSGRLIKTFIPSHEINLSGLKTGKYIVSLKMEDGNTQNISTIKR